MLEHADGDDPVELGIQIPVVGQLESGPVRNAGLLGPLVGYPVLSGGQGNSKHPAAEITHQGEAHSPPPAADIEDRLARLQQQLVGDVALLSLLGPFKCIVRILEIGAAVLPILVQEQFVEFIRQVVVVLDVGARSTDRIVLGNAPSQLPCGGQELMEPRTAGRLHVDHHQFEKPGQVVLFDYKTLIHVAFAHRQCRLDAERPKRPAVRYPDPDRVGAAIAELLRRTIRHLHLKGAGLNDTTQHMLKCPFPNVCHHLVGEPFPLKTVFRYSNRIALLSR